MYKAIHTYKYTYSYVAVSRQMCLWSARYQSCNHILRILNTARNWCISATHHYTNTQRQRYTENANEQNNWKTLLNYLDKKHTIMVQFNGSKERQNGDTNKERKEDETCISKSSRLFCLLTDTQASRGQNSLDRGKIIELLWNEKWWTIECFISIWDLIRLVNCYRK